MLDFVTRTADLNAKGKLVAEKRKYQGQTITDMRQDLIERAKATIKIINDYKSGTLRAPMARSIRNGIEVKIGYGKRNTGFYEGPKENRVLTIPELQVQRSRKILAIEYLQQAIVAVSAGEFDALLNKALADMTARFSGAQADNVYQFAAE